MRNLTLAYLTNQYPAVSHTFIRREIRELERRGHTVHRFSVRASEGALVDPQDTSEKGRTHCILGSGVRRLIGDTLRVAVARPGMALRGLWRALELGIGSEAGLLKHGAYLIEALVLIRRFERLGIEHVHVHHGTNPATVMLIVEAMGGPGFSMTVHGPPEFDAPRGLRLREKAAAARFVVAVSDFGRAQLERWIEPKDWCKVRVVRCGVGPEFFDESGPQTDSEAAPTFVTLGRLCPQKAHHTVLEAMVLLRARGLRAKLVIAGEGERRTLIERMVGESDLSECTELTGALSEAGVRARLQAATAMVLASSAEGLPMAIVEALAMGVPVIATEIAGIPELLDESCGRVVPPARPDLLADAMFDIARMSVQQRRTLGAEGRRRAHEQHSVHAQGERLEAEFLKIVASQPRHDG